HVQVSEGVDFADSRGRAVVITGIPYASSKDPKVILKKKILDDAQAKDRSVNTVSVDSFWDSLNCKYADTNTCGLNSYCDLRIYRVTNGRVIRHRKDYGAILLCDERFASPAVISQLSAWVRSSIAVYKNFGETQGQVAKFFKSMEGMKGLTTLSERNIKGPSAPDTQAGGHHALLADESLKSIFEQLIPNPPQKPDLIDNVAGKNIVVQYEATMPSSALSTNGAPSLRRSLLDTINSSQPGNILEKNKQNFTFSFHKTELNQPKVKLQSKLNHTTPELSKTLEGSSMSKNISHNKVVTSGDAKEYLEQIKSVIGPIGYGNFQQLLREYRSKMVTINQFIDRLIQLFERHQRLDMARGFKVFIPLKHHDLFQSAVNKLGKQF
ncbi:helicase C-terminal domain-containing protein, partial [Endogone sp. FLAS-F59071]